MHENPYFSQFIKNPRTFSYSMPNTLITGIQSQERKKPFSLLFHLLEDLI